MLAFVQFAFHHGNPVKPPMQTVSRPKETRHFLPRLCLSLHSSGMPDRQGSELSSSGPQASCRNARKVPQRRKNPPVRLLLSLAKGQFAQLPSFFPYHRLLRKIGTHELLSLASNTNFCLLLPPVGLYRSINPDLSPQIQENRAYKRTHLKSPLEACLLTISLKRPWVMKLGYSFPLSPRVLRVRGKKSLSFCRV